MSESERAQDPGLVSVAAGTRLIRSQKSGNRPI